MTIEQLSGERLLTLQHLTGLTQGELAARLGVSGGFLSHVTAGTKAFPATLARTASAEFKVPMAFFGVRLAPEDVGPVTFKKTSAARARDEKRVVALFTEASRLFRYASEASGYQTTGLPTVPLHGDPEDVAAQVRSLAGVSLGAPIRNVTRLAERLGVGVVHTLDPDAHDENAHAGASRPSALTTRPLIALACALTGAEQRFTLAHELFHVMADQDLDRGLTLVRDPRELRANRFAGALLLPPEAAQRHISETLTLNGYLKVKAEFGLSVGAIIHRAHDLNLISDRRQKSLYIQWSSAGWRKNEPVPVASERPLLLDQALRRVYGRSHLAKASHDTGVPAQLISAWVEASSDVEMPDLAAVVPLRRGMH